MRWKTLLCTLGLALLPSAAALPLTLDDLLSPFEHLDLGWVYDHYSGIIDFLIYAFIFVGVAHAAFGRRFPGRAGEAISAGTGLALALGLVTAEKTLGFTIRSFGPAALMLLMLLFALMIYRLARHTEFSPGASAGLAYAVAFFAVLTSSPDLYLSLRREAPILALLADLLLIVACIGIVSHLWPSSLPHFAPSSSQRAASTSSPKRRETTRKAAEIIRREARPQARAAVRESRDLLGEIVQVRNQIQRSKDPAARRDAASRIDKLLQDQHDLRERVDYLRRLNEQMLRLDASLLGDIKHARPEEKARLREQVRDESARLGIEERLRNIEAAAEQLVQAVTRHLTQAAQALRSGRADEATRALDHAITAERSAKRLAKQTRRLESVLLGLAERDARLEATQR